MKKVILLLSLAPALLAPARAAAQTVRGQVVGSGAEGAIAGARVLLLDNAGRRVAAAVTGPDGAYRLVAPTGGSYLLRVERIGFAATSARVELRDGGVIERRLVSGTRPVMLAGVTALSGRASRCQVRPDSGQQTATLWEEARKALDLANRTRAERLYLYRLRNVVRDLGGPGMQVRSERVAETSGASAQPFFSAPLAELAANGFIQQVGDSLRYYAPGAEVLLSDAFLDTHCFRLAAAADSPGVVGLAFEPVRGRRTIDVRGVLWLDRATAQLRWLDYAYTDPPLPGPEGVPGGRIEFKRLPNAAWIVSRWLVRMPYEERHTARDPADPAPPPTLAVREKLAEVVDVVTRGGEHVDMAPPAYATLEGVVFDSTRGAPVYGARVFLSGTNHAAVTDSAGRFVLGELRPGTYTLSFASARIDTLGYVPPPQQVTLAANAVERRELTVPAGAGAAAAEAAALASAVRAAESPGAAVPLRPVNAVGIVRSRTLEASGFYARRHRGMGVFLTDSAFNRNTPLENVLRTIPGVRVIRLATNSLGSSIVGDRDRPVGTGTRSETRVVSARSGVSPSVSQTGNNSVRYCYIPVYVDGVEAVRGDEIQGNDLGQVKLERVIGVEVYRSASEAPVEFGGINNPCGVILVWTEAGPRGSGN